MTIEQAVLLGLVQGITEFLPISSSGHQVLLEHYLQIDAPTLQLGIVLHLATAFSILAHYWKKIFSLKLRMVMMVVLGIIPAGIIGYFFIESFEALFQSVAIVSSMLLITGFLNIRVYLLLKSEQKRIEQNKLELSDSGVLDLEAPSLLQSIKVGLQQVVALVPGISRSATTLSAALSAGIPKDLALFYVLLLFIPLALASSIFEIFHPRLGFELSANMMIGALVAFLVGYLSVGILKKAVYKKELFLFFAFYCWIVGVFSLLLV